MSKIQQIKTYSFDTPMQVAMFVEQQLGIVKPSEINIKPGQYDTGPYEVEIIKEVHHEHR